VQGGQQYWFFPFSNGSLLSVSMQSLPNTGKKSGEDQEKLRIVMSKDKEY
jgi:hypothetical protein